MKPRHSISTFLRRILLCAFIFGTFALFASPTQKPAHSEFHLGGNDHWPDTGLDLQTGDTLTVVATGGSFHSDGRVLVLVLGANAASPKAAASKPN